MKSLFDETHDKKDGRLILSQFFHDLGIILHFQDDKASVLYDTVILNPEWGTQAVYELLKRENNPIKEKLGKFNFDDLETIWRDDRYQGKYRQLLELMKRFKLCYELPSGTYIAPQLLDQNSPNYVWNTNNNLKFRYHYDFMPKGILSRFIVEMHS
ncbi:MAG: COR domain-containing protein [Crocosphaera sp.]|nr:COR domain-containing protein [Crocosphaera sp.]